MSDPVAIEGTPVPDVFFSRPVASDESKTPLMPLTVAATLPDPDAVTSPISAVMPLPGGTANVPSALRNLPAAAEPDGGAGTMPALPPEPVSPTITRAEIAPETSTAVVDPSGLITPSREAVAFCG
jgi:hypothetical protein